MHLRSNAAVMLIPLSVVIYTSVGGLKGKHAVFVFNISVAAGEIPQGSSL